MFSNLLIASFLLLPLGHCLDISDCSYNSSCSPSWCIPATNPRCNNTKSTNIDPTVVSNVYSLGCRACSQFTSTTCTSSYLKSVLRGVGVKAAYCNDKYFVIHTNGRPNHNDGLATIPRPPGEGGVVYSKACVTRSFSPSYNVYKIPLFPQLLPSASLSNNLAAFVGQSDPAGLTSYGLPVSGPVAVTISGQNIFPIFNNVGVISHAMCEMDKCSAHAGQGFDYHYHGDPFGSVNGTCMYSLLDYSSVTAHPPLIGWSFDGFSIFGRYLDVNAIGYSDSLDICGGHVHADADGTTMVYHYHAQVLSEVTSAGQPYKAYIGGVFNCWRGNITIDQFFGNSVAFKSRPDYNNLKPCCGSTDYYLKPGYSLQLRSPTAAPTKVYSSPSPSKTPVTAQPTVSSSLPTKLPTSLPRTSSPTAVSTSKTPTLSPSMFPSLRPTTVPTFAPRLSPTVQPTSKPSTIPPTPAKPTATPTSSTLRPSRQAPTSAPSTAPTLAPSSKPALLPTAQPSGTPSTINPTTKSPSTAPTNNPTYIPPSAASTTNPTSKSPTANPTSKPPSAASTIIPTTKSPSPSSTTNPTSNPPSAASTIIPTSKSPSAAPSLTSLQTARPTSSPTTTANAILCPYFSSSSASAVSYCYVSACNGKTVTVSACSTYGGYCTGDAKSQVFASTINSQAITSNDNYCGSCPQYSFTAPSSGCQKYIIVEACNINSKTTSCAGQFAVTNAAFT